MKERSEKWEYVGDICVDSGQIWIADAEIRPDGWLSAQLCASQIGKGVAVNTQLCNGDYPRVSNSYPVYVRYTGNDVAEVRVSLE
jgi:hypothetical protein